MNLPPKAPSALQSYQTILYNRALHPEFFALRDRRVILHGDYEFESWLMDGGHLLRFEFGGLCASELVSFQEDGLPDSGVVSAFLCAGERDFEHEFKEHGVKYMTTVQTETLSENLYAATFDEMIAHAEESGAMIQRWRDEVGRCLSIVDVQRFATETHTQAYHLLASGGIVLRTQTIFEHR